MAFSNFPYTDFHNLNLDWVLATTKDLNTKWDDYYTQWNQWQSDVQNYIDNLDYIQAIDDYLDTLKANGELSNIINTWLTDYNIVCIGDSYGQGYTPDGSKKVTSWIELFESKYFKGHPIYSKAEGGAGFAATGQANHTFTGMLSELTATIPVSEREKVKYVIVAGGWNDIFFKVNAITAGITQFVELATTAYPNAEICIGFIAAPSSKALTTTERWNGWRNAKTAYETTWTNYRVLVGANIGLRWFGLLASDSVHPNQNGQNSLADSLYKSIVNGSYEGNRYSDDFSVANGAGTFNYNKVTVQYNNNMFDVQFGTHDFRQFFSIAFTTPLADLNETTTKLGILNLDFLPESATCMCPCIIQDETGYHNAFCNVFLNPIFDTTKTTNEIWMKLLNVTSGAFVTFRNIKSIQFYGLRFSGMMY